MCWYIQRCFNCIIITFQWWHLTFPNYVVLGNKAEYSTTNNLSTNRLHDCHLHFSLKQTGSACSLKAMKLMFQDEHGGRPAGNRYSVVSKNRWKKSGKPGIYSCAFLCGLHLGNFGCDNRLFFCVTWKPELSDTQSLYNHLE